MKALILYALFVAAGTVASALLGIYVEREISTAVSLIVFISLFFANFVISWLLVVLVMDGTLKNMHGAPESTTERRS